jgi:hypothetical protein
MTVVINSAEDHSAGSLIGAIGHKSHHYRFEDMVPRLFQVVRHVPDLLAHGYERLK